MSLTLRRVDVRRVGVYPAIRRHMRDVLDVLLEMPYHRAVAVQQGALNMCVWLDKWRQNPRSYRQDRWEFHGDFYLALGGANVARKNRKSNQSTGGAQAASDERSDLRFINVKIPDGDVGNVEGLLVDYAALCERFVSYTAHGGEILVKRKRGTDDWLAMLTVSDPHRDGGLCAVTAWGSNPADAIAALVWKWEGLLVGEVPEPSFSDNGSTRRFG